MMYMQTETHNTSHIQPSAIKVPVTSRKLKMIYTLQSMSTHTPHGEKLILKRGWCWFTMDDEGTREWEMEGKMGWGKRGKKKEEKVECDKKDND